MSLIKNLLLASAAVLTMSSAANARMVIDSLPGPMGTDPLVTFTEQMDATLVHITDQVHSIDRGIEPFTIFQVDKFVHNVSTAYWSGYDVQLQVLEGKTWMNSPDTDGVSFGDIESLAVWLSNSHVDINGVDQGAAGGSWTVSRNTMLDVLHFDFNGFTIHPGNTLSLHFDMSDSANNVWRMVQTALPGLPPEPLPEPLTLALFGFGLAALGFMRRSGSAQAKAD